MAEFLTSSSLHFGHRRFGLGRICLPLPVPNSMQLRLAGIPRIPSFDSRIVNSIAGTNFANLPPVIVADNIDNWE